MSKYPIQKTEEQWLEELGPEGYRILREKGTERPFTGKYNLTVAKGTYACGACGTELFESNSKFDSGCGWPSFDESIDGLSVDWLRFTNDQHVSFLRNEMAPLRELTPNVPFPSVPSALLYKAQLLTQPI